MAASILTLTAAPFGQSTRVAADKYDDQIAAIQQQINGYNASADTLAKQADSLQTELNKMANEQAQLQAQIQLNQTKYDQLQQQIDDTKKKSKTTKMRWVRHWSIYMYQVINRHLRCSPVAKILVILLTNRPTKRIYVMI